MEARQPFSRLGWALFAQMAVMLAAQWGVLLLARAARPGLLGEPVFLWAASVLGAYGLGIPAACLVLWGTAAPPAPGPPPAGAGRLRGPLAGSVGLAYLANGATLLLTGLLGRLRGAAVVNPVESIGLYPLPFQLLLAGSSPLRRRSFCSAGCCCAACGPMGALCAGGLRPLLRPVSRKSEPVFLCLSSGAGAGGAGALHRLPVAGRPPPRAGQPPFPSSGVGWAAGGGDGCADAGRRHGAVPADPRASGPSGRQSAEHGGAFSPAPACSASARCPCPWRCLI